MVVNGVLEKTFGQKIWDSLQEDKKFENLILQTKEEDELDPSFFNPMENLGKGEEMLSGVLTAFIKSLIWEFRDSERPEKDLNITMRVE